MRKKLLSVCVALTLGAGAGYATSVLAQAKPEQLVKQRQAAMVLQSKYWGPMSAMMQGKAPYNADVAVRNARYLEVLAHMAWDGFSANTKDAEHTKALPAIWENEAKFKDAQDKFQAAAKKLAASASDEGEFKAAAKQVGQSCGGCHKEFRAK